MYIIKDSKRPRTARRALMREVVGEHGSSLDWVYDPSLVPDRAAFWLDRSDEVTRGNPYQNIAEWMTMALAVWARKHANKLGYQKAFDSEGLSGDERVSIRTKLTDEEYLALMFRPGNQAMAEIVELVPVLGTREGVPREQWTGIARQAKTYGAAIARDGTQTQALTRQAYGFREGTTTVQGPENYKLDAELGITTVDDKDLVLLAAKEIVERRMVVPDGGGTCLALQVKMPGTEISAFDAIWDTYVEVASRVLYPHLGEAHLVSGPVREPLPSDQLPNWIETHNEAYIMRRTPAYLSDIEVEWVDRSL